jgi:hypothetical protein
LFGLQIVTCLSRCTRDNASKWLRAWTPEPMMASDDAVFRASNRDETADTAAVRASVI